MLTVHDVIPLKWPRYFLGNNILAFPDYLISIYLSLIKANRIIMDSQNSAEDVNAVYPFARNKGTVIHLGLDTPKLSKDKHFGLDSPYIIYFGGIDKRKNIIGLMRAFFQSEGSRTYRLVIVGKNSDSFKKEAQELGIMNKTDFIGYVSEEEKYRLLRDATALVYPSFYEGFGIPPLEAMSVGTPVICSNTSSLPEIAGEAALLINPYDIAEMAAAMDRLTTDKDLQQGLRLKGLEQVKKYSWDKMVEETLKVYEEVLSQGELTNED